jgi:5S rRNA maturation endonuclease (ribonuclease M5)
VYWHTDDKTGRLWCWCCKCGRAYTIDEYCRQAGIDIEDFLNEDFKIENGQSDEVNVMAWPSSFVPLSDPRAQKGVEYIKSRGLDLDGDMYYDLEEEGIVFPYYFENHFCGAQVRFIEERVTEDGNKWKITTLPGTRLGLLFYGWNQSKLMAQIKAVVVCEGAFNAISIQQALNKAYGGISRCPWRVIACSGSGVSQHQADTLKELKEKGYKVVCASDSDEAGLKMYDKLKAHGAITHYAFSDIGVDWNDKLKELGHKDFAKYFISRLTYSHD